MRYMSYAYVGRPSSVVYLVIIEALCPSIYSESIPHATSWSKTSSTRKNRANKTYYFPLSTVTTDLRWKCLRLKVTCILISMEAVSVPIVSLILEGDEDKDIRRFLISGRMLP